MKVRLVVVSPGRSHGMVIRVNRSTYLIGSDPGCPLRSLSAEVSGRHCAILIEEGYLSLRDLDSVTGTFINGVPVSGERALAAGDTIRIGPMELRVELFDASVDQPTPLPPTIGTRIPARPSGAPEIA